MTGTGWNTDWFRDVSKAHYALLGSALVLLHSGTRVLVAAAGSAESALAIIGVLDPARLLLVSAAQVAAYLFLPATVAVALYGLAQAGRRLLASVAAVLLLAFTVLLGSLGMAVIMTVALTLLLLGAGQDGADGVMEPWQALILGLLYFMGSAGMPLRPMEVIEIRGEVPFVGRVYGEDRDWLVVQSGASGPLRYVKHDTLDGREICQGEFDVLYDTVADVLRSSAYRSCP